MDAGKHRTKPPDLWSSLLPSEGSDSYPRLVALGQGDERRIRVDRALWDAYADVVGDGGRAADVRAYIEWRVKNPDAPLPGEWRGPVKREHQRRADTPKKPRRKS
jgi:hypothetical protein